MKKKKKKPNSNTKTHRPTTLGLIFSGSLFAWIPIWCVRSDERERWVSVTFELHSSGSAVVGVEKHGASRGWCGRLGVERSIFVATPRRRVCVWGLVSGRVCSSALQVQEQGYFWTKSRTRFRHPHASALWVILVFVGVNIVVIRLIEVV